MESGSDEQQTPSVSDLDIVLKLKADKILHPSSDSNSELDSMLVKKSQKSSPVLGGAKGYYLKLNSILFVIFIAKDINHFQLQKENSEI